MQILTSQTANLPLAQTSTQSKVGKVLNPVFEPSSGKILGFQVSVSLFQKPKIVSISDIVSLDKTALVISDENSILDEEEIIRIAEILKSGITVLDQKAQTEGGQNLGKVSDILIDTATLSITKFYLRGLLQERILSFDKVSKITKEAVIFKDDVLEEIESMEPELAA